ncbi:hypothetical protein ACQR10_04500 [Bradyrhizobium sp. HKCCYLRH2060]|uniref:hypothetical protein n=1 Tax=Bradyrhizobium sp. HKCCYLRH2060 TaxID=3420743 RepID=UPI003EBB43E8
MAEVFDLFGDPVPANWGERGRPGHIPTQQNRNRVSMLVALGWGNGRIAAALFITVPTLRKHYFSELHYRAVARDRLTTGLFMKLWEQVQEGNVGAIKEFRAMLDRNDLMLYGHAAQPSSGKPAKQAKQPKLGKKEAAIAAAQNPDRGSALGDLIAQRQGGGRPN